MEKFGFVYIWRDRKHKRYYIGCHWGTEDDGYICSSRWMRQSYRRRPEDFKRRILERIYDKRKLLKIEYKWLQMIKEEELKNRYYNIHKHHFGHWSLDDTKAKSSIEKMANSLKQRAAAMSVEERKEYFGARNKGKTSQFKGKKHTEEAKAMIRAKRALQKNTNSEAMKGRIPWNKGKTGIYSEETKQKMVENRKQKMIMRQQT